MFQAPFNDPSQWTIGKTSAYPGTTNPGDHKADRIGSQFAPDSDGTFAAVRDGQYWDADLATTEYSPGNFQARVGDTLTAHVTLNPQQGAWPAIWTWSTGALQNLPGHGEVDLFEYHGDNPRTLELTNHVQPSSYYWTNAPTAFDLRVDFDQAGVKYWINGTLIRTLTGLPADWRSNLIVNMSVASTDNPWHPAPTASATRVTFKVEGLKVWR